MALHQMALFGSTPIGAVLMGWIIQISSPRVPFALGGLSAILCAAAVIGPHRRLGFSAIRTDHAHRQGSPAGEREPMTRPDPQAVSGKRPMPSNAM